MKNTDKEKQAVPVLELPSVKTIIRKTGMVLLVSTLTAGILTGTGGLWDALWAGVL